MEPLEFSEFLHDLTKATKEFDLNYHCFSLGQLKSKEWLIEKLNGVCDEIGDNLGIVFNLCGWYGILPAMMFTFFEGHIEKVRSFDIDDDCREIANRINRTSLTNGWRFQAVTEDIFNINFQNHIYELYSYNKKEWFEVEDSPDTIINTSCEHTKPDWYKNVPSGKFIILQSNNFFSVSDHINCVTSVEELKNMFPMKELYFEGYLELDLYTRFMLIGTK